MSPTGYRLGFRGLAALVRAEFGRDPRCGDLFLFVNRRRRAARLLVHYPSGHRVELDGLRRAEFLHQPAG